MIQSPSPDAGQQAAPGPGRAPRGAEFDAMYAGTPPWDIGRPQPALLALADAGELRGRNPGRRLRYWGAHAHGGEPRPGGKPEWTPRRPRSQSRSVRRPSADSRHG